MRFYYFRTTSAKNNADKKNGEDTFFSSPGKARAPENSGQFFNGASSSFFTPVQTKSSLSVGQPGDRYEREADGVADRVVNGMNVPAVQAKCQDCAEEEKVNKKEAAEIQRVAFESEEEEAIQTKCEACAHEEENEATGKIMTKPSGRAGSTEGLQAKLQSAGGKGESLPDETRSEMETAFGTDFSGVRVHTGSGAEEMNAQLNAQAFTHGQDIYFNRGKYDARSKNGKHLLAHELTHVVQQNGEASPPAVQRFSNEDFAIRGLDPSTRHVQNTIRFEYGEARVPPVEYPKIRAEAVPAGRDVTLNGYSSEEGTGQAALTNRRIGSVRRMLTHVGHTGPKHPNPNPTAGEGNIDYRSMRVVEIVDTPTGGSPVPTEVPDCDTESTEPCAGALFSAFPLAIQKVVAAISALSSPTPATLAQVRTYFGGNDPNTIRTNLFSLMGMLIVLGANHKEDEDCHLDACDGGCVGANAYVSRTVSPPKMVLCEGFTHEPDVSERAETFIHEALHATPGVLTDDIAYAHTRRIRTLSDAEMLRNTDSYVNLISVLHDPSASVATPPSDTISGTANAAESDHAQSAIDYLEQWLIAAKFGSSGMYEKIQEALDDPTTWTTASRQWYHRRMHSLSSLFDLTDPGTSAPFTLPDKDDKVRMAGISDRYLSMRSVMHGHALSLTKIAAGADSWRGRNIEVTQPFFSMSLEDAIIHLVRLLASSRSDIPPGLLDSYITGVNEIRNQRSVGP